MNTLPLLRSASLSSSMIKHANDCCSNVCCSWMAEAPPACHIATASNNCNICCAGKAAKYLGKLGKKIASNFGASDQEPKPISGARKVISEGDGDLGTVTPPASDPAQHHDSI